MAFVLSLHKARNLSDEVVIVCNASSKTTEPILIKFGMERGKLHNLKSLPDIVREIK